MNWPAHSYEQRPWQQAYRGGTKDDRMLREITVALPPLIAERSLTIDAPLAADVERAMREISRLEGMAGDLGPVSILLLRTESVASSKIEAVEAGLDDYARALHGVRSNSSAVSMVAATTAIEAMIGEVARTGRIELDVITSAHRILMRDDPAEAPYAGNLRTVQNWIGGSDHSPRGALYVPPPPDTVPNYLQDLLGYANRDDLPVLLQAAITHAQFESIHPFTDGNGRIGRALINAVLRRRGATTKVVVPLASALVARRERYFDLLNSYRSGDVGPLIETFAESSLVAATEARTSAARLAGFPAEWRDLVGRVRSGSTVERLLELLPSQPILSADDVFAAIAAPRSSIFEAINRLREVAVLRPLTDRKRDQVWGAALILDELDDLGVRIAHASR